MFQKLAHRFGAACLVNDPHSKLNETAVAGVRRPSSLDFLLREVRTHAETGRPLAICGSRHSMGGQQFLSGHDLLDMRKLGRVLNLDRDRGVVNIEAGIEWPDLVSTLHRLQPGVQDLWTISTKQTGADKMTLGGAISCNAHGRTLDRGPISAGVESIELISPKGELIACSRSVRPDLFQCAVGGYGMFGPIYSAKLQLERRHKLNRVVGVTCAESLMDDFADRIGEGFTLGDWQFAIDDASEDFLQRGVFSCYRPAPIDTPISKSQRKISRRVWNELVYLAHYEKTRAFQLYRDYYLSTMGQVYWSDTSQLGGYEYDYHVALDRRVGADHPATEMITELYVPPAQFAEFMARSASWLRQQRANLIYGTVRLIRQDRDSLLPWAREDYACAIFNIHVEHTEQGLGEAAEVFQGLIDIACRLGGSFYLTYHRWAGRDQIEACYPRFPEFISRKRAYDPDGIFQSDWYRHVSAMFPEVA